MALHACRYGRTGVVINAISGVDLALWDIVGKALGMPVYKLLGGETKPRIPAYCTGNDIEQHIEFGFKRLKLAIPHGPADGREGMRKNIELVKRTREALGPDGDIMLDCWMAWTERYTLEMAEMVAPYRVYWMEEVPAAARLRGIRAAATQPIKSTRIVTGEHEYTRYGFRQLLEHTLGRDLAARHPLVRRPDRTAADRGAGGRLRHSGDPARRRRVGIACTSSWRRRTAPGRSCSCRRPGVHRKSTSRFEEDNHITRGPEGIYMRPSESPGLGWDVDVSA